MSSLVLKGHHRVVGVKVKLLFTFEGNMLCAFSFIFAFVYVHLPLVQSSSHNYYSSTASRISTDRGRFSRGINSTTQNLMTNNAIISDANADADKRQLEKLLDKIVHTDKLNYCSLLVFNSGESKVEKQQSETFVPTIFRDTLILFNNNDNDNDTRTSSNLRSKAKPTAHSKLKKLGANCIISLIFLNSQIMDGGDLAREKGLQQVHEKLTKPLSSPPTRRNTDFYIFIIVPTVKTSQKLLDKILLSPHTSFRFAYKLALAIVPQTEAKVSENVRVKTLCFYCARDGSPLVIDIHMENSASNHLEIDTIFPNMLKNLNGGLISASAVSTGPSTQLKRGPHRPDKSVEWNELWNWIPKKTGGAFFRAFATCAEALNFTFQIRPSTGGGGSGLLLKNGTWNGVLGDVLYDRVDVGVVFGLTLNRIALVGYTSPWDFLALTFAHGPSEPIYTWKFIFWPLSPSLWSMIVMTVVVSILFLETVSVFEIRRRREGKFSSRTQKHMSPRGRRMRNRKFREIWTLDQIIMFILPSCLGQHFIKAEDNSVKCFVVPWLLFIIVISNVYLSKLFGFFVTPQLEDAPSTFDELPNSGYELGMTYYGGAIYSWFKNAPNDSSMHKVYKKMEKRKTLDCLRDTLVKKYVCISYATSIEYAVQVQIGDKYGQSSLIQESAVAFELPITFSVSKQSILTESLSRVATGNFESGLINFWRLKSNDELRHERLEKEELQRKNSSSTANTSTSSSSSSSSSPSNHGEPISLTIDHFRGAFTILIFGSLISSSMFLSESSLGKLYTKRNHRKQNKNNNNVMDILMTNKSTRIKTADIDYTVKSWSILA